MLLAVLPAIPQREPRCRSILPSSSATRSRVVDRRYRCVQCGTANVTGVQTACHSRSPTNPGRRSPPRHRHYPHKCPTHRGFVQSGFCEVALTSPLPVPVVPATSQNPQDSGITPARFDHCAFLFHSLFAVTFATQSALNGPADTHQICPMLKVDRPCHRAAVTSQFDPKATLHTFQPDGRTENNYLAGVSSCRVSEAAPERKLPSYPFGRTSSHSAVGKRALKD
jgi:hypothetical protein